MNIALSDRHAIELDELLSNRMLIQANSGGGKSYALRRLLEQSHGHVQHLVIDLEGEFSTLRERFPYVLAAQEGGDTSVQPRIARVLAERLLELRASTILDISELRADERILFVRDFLGALVHARKDLWHPALVVIDEAHVFCPQQGEAASAGAVIDLATRGRKRGFAAVLATQRLSKLHKDAAAECNVKLIGRTGLDVDVRRAADELGFGKDRWRELRELLPGRFFGFGPGLSREVVAVDIGRVLTTHPRVGDRISKTPPPAPEKVRALLPKLADLPAEAEQREKSIEDLRRELAQVRRELTLAKRAAPPAPAPKRVEVPVLEDKDRMALHTEVDRIAKESRTLAQLSERILSKLNAILMHRDRGPVAIARSAPAARANGDARVTPAAPRPAAAPPVRPGEKRSASQQRILDALAWLEAMGLSPADRTQVGLLSDLAPSSGNFANNLGRLRSLGFVEYPSPGRLLLTDSGRAMASQQAREIPSTDEALHDQICRKLSGSQERILRELIATYPAPMPRATLAERVGLAPDSGNYANNLGRLRSLGVIDYPSPAHAVALPVLFVEAR